MQHKKIAIVGLGALGSWCASLLAKAGATLLLIDRDIIEKHNLVHQNIYTKKDIGQSKAKICAQRLVNQSFSQSIQYKSEDLRAKNAHNLLENHDLVLGCTDNLESRRIINHFCKQLQIPWIHGAATGMKGTVLPIFATGPCFDCVIQGNAQETCQTAGLMNSCAVTVASIMVSMSYRMLKESFEPMLLHIDSWQQRFQSITVNKRSDCEVCAGKAVLHENKNNALCGRNTWQFDIPYTFEEIKNHLPGKPTQFAHVMHYEDFTFFDDNRVYVKAKSVTEAKSKLHKLLPH